MSFGELLVEFEEFCHALAFGHSLDGETISRNRMNRGFPHLFNFLYTLSSNNTAFDP